MLFVANDNWTSTYSQTFDNRSLSINVEDNESVMTLEPSLIEASRRLKVLRYYVYHIITPGIFLFGLIANTISLFLGNRIRHGMSAVERSSAMGLVAMAASDLLFCAVGLPEFFVVHRSPFGVVDYQTDTSEYSSVGVSKFYELRLRFSLYYGIYRGPIHNVFLMSSTWIVVAVSAERCFAIYRPIRARLLAIRAWRAAVIYAAVFAGSLAICAPQFARYSIASFPCGGDFLETELGQSSDRWCSYAVLSDLFLSGSMFRRVYYVVLLIVGYLLPTVILVVAGSILVRALYLRRRSVLAESIRLSPSSTISLPTSTGQQSCTGESQGRGAGRQMSFTAITATVVLIISSFFVLVGPSMIVESIGIIVGAERMTSGQVVNYQIAIVISNLLLAVKVAGNFVFFARLSRRRTHRERQTGHRITFTSRAREQFTARRGQHRQPRELSTHLKIIMPVSHQDSIKMTTCHNLIMKAVEPSESL